MSKSQLFLGVQHQSPSTTQIPTRNFEQAFDRVNDLIFGPILIWNWRFLSPLQLFRRKLSQIPLLKSCFGPHNAKRSKLSTVLRHVFLVSPECRGIESSMLRHWLFCQFSSISDAVALCAQCCSIEATDFVSKISKIQFSSKCPKHFPLFLLFK